MDVTWMGRRCFSIKGKDGTVLTDPYADLTPRLAKGPTINAITLSRKELADQLPSTNGKPGRIIKGPGEYEIANILITGVGTLHESESQDGQGQPVRGTNTVYAIELEGVVLCHLGELQRPLTSEQVEEMGDVSVLMMPLGDPNCFRASMDTISLLEPRLVLPMDYDASAVGTDGPPQPLSRLLKEMGGLQAEPQRRLHITPSTLPLQTQIAVLENLG